MQNGHDDKVPLSADYVPEGTYPAEICVLRYALERHAKTKPDEIFAAFEGGERWTFAQTLERVVNVAGNLHALGVRQHDHVLLVMPTCPLALAVMFAANYLGAVYVPVNPALKGSSLQHVLDNSGAKIAVVHDSVLGRVLAAAPATLATMVHSSDEAVSSDGNVTMRGVSALTRRSAPPPAPVDPIKPFDTQSIIYTSGTTGRSKGVLSSYMHAFSCVGPDAWNCLAPDDRQMLHMPIFHIGGAFIATVSLCMGSSIGVVGQFRTEAFWDQVRALEITSAFLLGAMATFLLKQPPGPRDRDHRLRMVFIVPLGRSATPFRGRFGVDVFTIFNMTEICTPLISRANPAKDNVCGRPRAGVEVRLVDAHDCPVKDGEVGQLILRTEAPWAMNHGYNANPQATADAWRNGWFHTGDAFFRDADGDYHFVDRLKDAIRRRGENISSYEIEVELLSHPAVREAAAIPVPSEHSEDEVMVVLAPAAGASIEPPEIIRHLQPRVAHHMIPRYIRIVDELPKTPTAKVEKHVLRTEGVTAETWDRERAGVSIRRETLWEKGLAMQKPRVTIYTDYKSPYAFVANKRLFELEEKYGVELQWLPYTLRVAEFMGTVEARTPHFWRKVKYAYMDARRYANAQGLTMKGPRKIYNAYYASVGMLFAQRHGFFRPYHDTVFARFWSHDLEIDELADIAGVIGSVGGSAEDFTTYAEGPARAEHERIIDEAEALGVFGVPSMVFNGELFWGGDRIDMLIERIKNPEGAAAALGSRHRKQDKSGRPIRP